MSASPIKTRSVAPVRKICHRLWDFYMEIRSCRYLWIRSHLRVIGILTKIFSMGFSMRAQSANPRRAERKSANSKNIRRIPICHHELACAFSPKYQALSFRGFFPRRNRAAFRTSPARATPHAVRTSEEQHQGVLAIDSGRAHRASHASVSEEGRVRGLPSSQIVCARRRGNDRGRA